MNTEQERADFEAWLRIKPCGSAHDFAWEAWQARAALASPEVQALRDALEAMMDYAGQPVSHPAAQLARAALAQEQGEKHDNQS